MDTPREPIMFIATRHDAPLPDPLGPPAQSTHADVEGPGRETFLLPTLDQRLDVLRLQALRAHLAVAELFELPGRELQHPQAVHLRRITAVGVVAAQQFELIVQVVHRVLPRAIGVAPTVSVKVHPWVRSTGCGETAHRRRSGDTTPKQPETIPDGIADRGICKTTHGH